MMEYTQGPWNYHINENGSARVTMPHEHLGRPCSTCQANARLIAAAPESFEVVKEVISLADISPSMTLGHYVEQFTERGLYKLVAKVEDVNNETK